MTPNKWALDAEHSEIQFKIRHLLISNITGHFNEFSGSMETKKHDTFENAEFTLKINVFSIDTNNTERDEHLKSEDFFNADSFPEITFHSTSFVHKEGDYYTLNGELSIKGIIKQVSFEVLFGGQLKDGFGIDRAGFEINGTINRNDFDIHANDVTEAGGLVLGEDIKLHANVQFTHKEA